MSENELIEQTYPEKSIKEIEERQEKYIKRTVKFKLLYLKL